MNHFGMLLSHLGLNHSMASMEKSSYKIVLKDKKQIAEGTMAFTFEKPKNFHFNAGQHVRMTLLNPSLTDNKGNSRFMTLANTPSEKNLVIAMRMTDSAFKRVLAKTKTGEKVLIQILQHSPDGSFVIHDDSSRPAIFLVGGIGIVPAYSMIKDAIEKKLKHKIYLFYSNRTPEDSSYLNELQSLSKKYSSFTFIPTMTKLTKSWKGETGYINQNMLKKYLHDLNTPIYYVAGLTDMVNAMKTLLKDLGVNENNIRSEDFSGVKMSIMNMSSNRNVKNYFMLAVIALFILVIIGAHVGITSSFSFKNISYFTIGLILTIIMFKLFVIFKLKHNFNLGTKLKK